MKMERYDGQGILWECRTTLQDWFSQDIRTVQESSDLSHSNVITPYCLKPMRVAYVVCTLICTCAKHQHNRTLKITTHTYLFAVAAVFRGDFVAVSTNDRLLSWTPVGKSSLFNVAYISSIFDLIVSSFWISSFGLLLTVFNDDWLCVAHLMQASQ